MRGAVAFALALHMQVESPETKRVILTTTLFIVLFTIVFMGGTALPMVKVNFLIKLIIYGFLCCEARDCFS